jgi:hypothetical protein
MQTVGTQWLMLTLTGSAAYVALVSTASGLPVMLFAVAAGPVVVTIEYRPLSGTPAAGLQASDSVM